MGFNVQIQRKGERNHTNILRTGSKSCGAHSQLDCEEMEASDWIKRKKFYSSFLSLGKMKSAVAELQRKRGETTTVSVQRSKILINNEEKDLKINKKETLKIENKKKRN